jgi:hypothetical protein
MARDVCEERTKKQARVREGIIEGWSQVVKIIVRLAGATIFAGGVFLSWVVQSVPLSIVSKKFIVLYCFASILAGLILLLADVKK